MARERDEIHEQRIEMDAIEHLIDADQKQIAGRPVQHRQIVARWHAHELRGGALGADPVDKVELTGHKRGGCWVVVSFSFPQPA